MDRIRLTTYEGNLRSYSEAVAERVANNPNLRGDFMEYVRAAMRPIPGNEWGRDNCAGLLDALSPFLAGAVNCHSEGATAIALGKGNQLRWIKAYVILHIMNKVPPYDFSSRLCSLPIPTSIIAGRFEALTGYLLEKARMAVRGSRIAQVPPLGVVNMVTRFASIGPIAKVTITGRPDGEYEGVRVAREYILTQVKGRKGAEEHSTTTLTERLKDIHKWTLTQVDYSVLEARVLVTDFDTNPDLRRQLMDFQTGMPFTSTVTGRLTSREPDMTLPYGGSYADSLLRSLPDLNPHYLKGADAKTIKRLAHAAGFGATTTWVMNELRDAALRRIGQKDTPTVDHVVPQSNLTENTMHNQVPHPTYQPQQPVAYVPFNTDRAAVEDIKHVYGVPVSQLTVAGLTAILTDRQKKVDELKAIPHKPAVIKKQITDLKAEIKEVLALTDELFPVKPE